MIQDRVTGARVGPSLDQNHLNQGAPTGTTDQLTGMVNALTVRL